MIPVSGSAYTYSYATLGEIVAWIIGWDLILEYAVGNMAVAVSWSGYFVQLCDSLFHLKFPLWLVNDHQTATDLLAKGGAVLEAYSSTALPIIAGHSIAFNLPALLIVAAVTVLLVYGIRESAHTNTTIVIIKTAVVVFVIAFGAFMVNPTNWHPFTPNGFAGLMSGAGMMFFGFLAVAMVTHIGDLADLTNIGTLFAFILVCIGVNVLRRVDPERARPFRVPFVPIFPILGVLLCLTLMLSLPVMTWIRFVVWLGIGLLIYFLYSVRHSKIRRGVDVGPTEDIPPPLIKT